MAIIKLNNQSISSVTALPTGVVDANALASGVGGKLLQVVQATDTTTFSSTSNSFSASGDIISITPSSTSSKILVLFSYNTYRGGANFNIFGTIYRDINGGGYTQLIGGRGLHQSQGYFGSPLLQKNSMTWLDAPNTTQQVNYQSYFTNETGGQPFEIGEGGGHYTAMQCLEIAG